ncbi:hypothetical protein BN1221_03267 [Brenneria goodwinii]|uniref:Uncharacterized protein n=1 Tax=Brenneria goodwinii TaxID=1109412 RepID=A0A0G4JY39_9GAMM|nr:hypothetical protein BN1221_03267 [Brenneria goodwinii]
MPVRDKESEFTEKLTFLLANIRQNALPAIHSGFCSAIVNNG